jgi:polyribonucleotide nucleotidyltransferase
MRCDVRQATQITPAISCAGGYIKRDGRPSDDEVLVSRIIDRTLRPLFPAGFCREVQILSWVLSYDQQVNTDPLALVSSSAALLASPIPFQKPISGVCVGMDPETNEFVVNPSRKFLETSRLNLFVSGTEDSVMMIEGAADFLTEEDMAAAIEVGMEVIKMQCKGLRMFADATLKARNVEPKLHLVRKPDETLYQDMYDRFGGEMDKAIRTGKKSKSEVYTAFDVVEKQVKAHFLAAPKETWPKGLDIDVKTTFKRMASEKMR